MTDDRWDIPSPKLAKLAAGTNTPSMRPICGSCAHRHPRGERCSVEVRDRDGLLCASGCRCTIGSEP